MWPFDIKKKRLAAEAEAAAAAQLERQRLALLQLQAEAEQAAHEAEHPQSYDERQRAVAISQRLARLQHKGGA